MTKSYKNFEVVESATKGGFEATVIDRMNKGWLLFTSGQIQGRYFAHFVRDLV